MAGTLNMNESRALEILKLKDPCDAGMVDRAYARAVEGLALFYPSGVPAADLETLNAARTTLLLARAGKLNGMFHAGAYRMKVARRLAESNTEGLSHIVHKWEEWETPEGIHRDLIARQHARYGEAV